MSFTLGGKVDCICLARTTGKRRVYIIYTLDTSIDVWRIVFTNASRRDMLALVYYRLQVNTVGP